MKGRGNTGVNFREAIGMKITYDDNHINHLVIKANTLSEAFNLGYLKKCLEVADVECQTGIETRDELVLFVKVNKDE